MDALKPLEENQPTALADAVAAMQREVIAALENSTPLPKGARLEANRVVITLRVVMRDNQVELAGDAPGQTHTISIEFTIGAQAGMRAEQLLDVASAEGVVNALMQVFGVPSFDSSARATVFRETFAPLSEAQAAALIASYLSGAAEAPAELRMARHMVNRLLEKGPAGVERGCQVVSEILRQHTVARVLRIIEETWKTPEAWA